eukprot:COSAG04_NODE_541_length_12866_cov_847.972351_17_plen_50_part_00
MATTATDDGRIKGMSLRRLAPLVDRLDDLLRRILILGRPLGLAQREVKV